MPIIAHKSTVFDGICQKNAICINLQPPIVFFFKRLLKTCIIIKRTCILIFSKIGLIDQSKPCAQIYSQKIAICIVIFLNRLFHTCIIVKRTCISIFSKIGLVDQSKPCAQIYCNTRKMHEFATTNCNF